MDLLENINNKDIYFIKEIDKLIKQFVNKLKLV
jgi:hypothetical protein